MDPLSHALVGASCAGSLKKSNISIGMALLVGGLTAMVPDLDALIRSTEYPLLNLKYHRHFTHALAFAPLASLILAFLFFALFRFFKKQVSFLSLYLVVLPAYVCHGLLDSMTNYGTHLLWPFSPRRESWNLISIIDPIFTLTILMLLLLAFFRKKRKYLIFSLIWIVGYLSLAYWQREASTKYMFNLAKQRGHVIERYEVKPSFGNIIVWRMQYQVNGRIYADALHRSFWAKEVFYPGESAVLVNATNLINEKPNYQEDVKDFAFFSDQWLIDVSSEKNDATMDKIIADARFSALPQTIKPLWGIRIPAKQTDKHVQFVNNIGSRNPNDFKILFKMIVGEPITS